PLDSELANGDVCEVITSKAEGAGPSRDWLGFVKTARARNKIRQWFTRERREEMVDSGSEQIAKVLRKQNAPLQRLMSHNTLTAVAQDLNYKDIESLYAAVGEGHVSSQHVVKQLVSTLGGEEGAEEDLAEAVRPRRGRMPQADPGVTVVGA